MKSLAEIKKILKETPQSGESKKSESVIYTGNKSTGNGQQKSTTNSKTTQGAKAVNTNSSKTTDTVLFKPGTASQSLWKSEKSFDKVLDTQKKAREEQSKSRKAYADFARDVLNYKGSLGRTDRELEIKRANNRLSDNDAIYGFNSLTFDDFSDIYRRKSGEVNARLDELYKKRNDNARNASYRVKGLAPENTKITEEINRLQGEIDRYKGAFDLFTLSGKAATGDEGLSDEAYRFKMDNLTEADAKSYANFYEKKASEKNIDYPDRVRYKSIADTYRKKYIDIKYGSIKNKPDFEENIAYKPENTDSRTAGSMSDQYYIINTDAKTLKEQGLEKGNEKYLLMTDDEKNIYNYLYNKSGLKEATDYLNYIDNMLNKRYADERLKEAREYGAEHPRISTIDTIVTSPVTAFVSGLGTLKAAVEGADENDPTMLAERIKSETRQSVMDNHIKSKAGQIIYSSFTSAVDNALNALVARGLVGATALSGAAKAKAIGRIGGALMGSEAAASGILAGKANGMSDRGAVAYGIAQGVIELLTEKYSIEKIMGESGTVVRTLLKNSFTEGSEEIASYWANMVLDEIAGQGVEKKYKGLIAQGYSAEEASKQIVTDIVYGNLESFIGGALAGGMMSAGTTLPGVISAGGVKNYNKQLELANQYNSMSEEERKEFDRKMAAEQAANVLSGDKVGPVEVATALDALGVPEPDKVAKAIENFKDSGKTSERLHNDARVADVMEMLNERGYFKKADSVEKQFDEESGIELEKDFEDYPYNQQTVLDDYVNSVNDEVVKNLNEVKQNKNSPFKRISLGTITDKAAGKIKQLTGFDVKGYSYAINSNALKHIEKRHGENGIHDKSMAKAEDVARVGYVINNYDSMKLLKNKKGDIIYSREFKGKDGNYAPLFLYTKKINGTYYSAVAAAENGYKKLWVVTAYISKNKEDVTQVLHDELSSLVSTSENGLASLSSDDSVTQTEGKVKGENENFRNETKKSDYVPPIKVNTSNENDRNMVKTITDGIGKEGRRAYHERIELEYTAGYNGNKAVFLRDFNAFYTKGFTGGKISEVNSRFSDRLTLGTRRAAFKAGQADRAAAIDAKYTEANRAVIRDGGLILNHNTEGREDIERLDELGKKFGVSIEIQDTVVNSRGNEVNGLYSQGEIKISKKAVDGFKSPEAAERFILGHELLHRVETLAPKQYVNLRERIYDYVQRQNSAEITAAENAVLKKDVDMDTAIDEIAADYIGNEKFALDTAMHDLTLAEKIRGMARDILDVLGIKKYSEAERIARVWEKACEEAKRSVKKADSKVGNDVKREGEVKYSIVTLSNGMKYVQADEQVTSGNDPKKWEQQIINYVNKKVRHGNDVVIPMSNGEEIKITGRTAWKLGYRNGVNEGKPINTTLYSVKGNASGVIDEIIQTSVFVNKKENKKQRTFGSGGFEYRKAFFRDLDGRYYQLTLSVGVNDEGKEAYNIGIIKKIQFPHGDKDRVMGSKARGTVSDNSIPQTKSEVNTSKQNNSEKSSTGDLNEVIRENEASEGKISISEEDIKAIQSIGQKSINDFTSDDIKTTEAFAKKYFKEMGVKSPFFRAWFGDWRANDNTPVKTVNVETIDLSDAILKNGDYYVPDTKWTIHAGTTLNAETRHYARGEKISVKALTAIKDILDNAVLLDTEVSTKSSNKKSENTAFMHKLYCPLKYNNADYIAKVSIEEFLNPSNNIERKAYHLQSIKIETADGRATNEISSASTPRSDTVSINTVSQLFKIVKQNDKNFQPKETSKVVNEDGTPKVVYHGTKEFGFSVFDTAKSDDNSTLFFTDDKDIASTYSGKEGIVKLQDFNNVDYSDKSPYEIAEALNSIKSSDDEFMEQKYSYIDKSAFDKINASIDHNAYALMDYIEGYNFDNEKENIKKTAEKLEEKLNNLDYGSISTPLYMLLHHSSVFSDSKYAKQFAELEKNVRLVNEIEKNGGANVIVGESLDGYSYYIYDIDTAKDILSKKNKMGIYAVHLNMKNPYIVECNGSNWNDITYYEVIPEDMKRFYKNGLWRHGTTREAAEYAKSEGFDGVIFKNITDNGGNNLNVSNKPVNVYVAFDSNQIKSATDNVGTFDKSNPDIRYSSGDLNEVIRENRGIEGYTEEEVKSISREGKGYVNYVMDKDITLKEFFNHSRRNSGKFEKLYIGKISEGMAEKINGIFKENDLDVDVSGEHYILTNDMLDHIEKGHGEKSNDSAEKVTASNIEYLKDVIDNPDNILFGGFTRDGNPTVVFEKDINNTTGVYVQFNSLNRNGLIGKTFYFEGKMNNEKGDTTANNVNNPVLYAQSDRGQSPFNNSLSQKTSAVNDNSVQNTKNNSEKSSSGKLNDVVAQAQEDLDTLIEAYGAFEQGEEPRGRDVEIPKKTEKDKNTRRYTRTAAEAEAIGDESAAGIMAAVASGAYSYSKVTDKAAWSRAERIVKNEGIEAARRQWDGLVASGKFADKNDIALAEYLLQMAGKNNDSAEVVRLVADISAMGTRAGQTVQALRLLKKMDGASHLEYIERVTKNIQRDLDKRFKDKAPKIEVDEELKEALAEAKNRDKIDAVTDEILTSIAKQMPSTWLDKWNAWRFLAMLGNVRTHIRNIIGNGIFVPAVKIKNTVAFALEAGTDKALKLAGKKGIERSKSIGIASKEYKDFAELDFLSVKDILTGGGKMNAESIVEEKRRIFKFAPLEKARVFNNNMLEAEDRVFLKYHYKNALISYLQANKVDIDTVTENNPEGFEVLERARNYAIKEAQKATYRDASAFSNGLNALSRQSNVAKYALDALLPFKKTPANILKRGVEYSPAGLIDTVTRGVYKVAKGHMTATEFVDRLASGLTGTGILALGTWLASLGYLVGKPRDDEEEFKESIGAQSYAIQAYINGKMHSYTIDWAAPVSLPLFVGAEIYRLIENDEKMNLSTFFDSLGTIADPIFELSMLDGINNTLASVKNISEDEKEIPVIMRELITSYFGQGVPTFLGQITRTFADNTRRRTYMDKNSGIPTAVQYATQRQMNKIPGLVKKQEPYINEWGQAEVTENILERAFENLISPGYYSVEDNNEVNTELMKLARETAENTPNSIFPKAMPKYFDVNGERKDLTAKEYTKFQQTAGQKSFELLKKAFETDTYKSMTTEEKVDLIETVYDIAKVEGKQAVSDYESKDDWITWAVERGDDAIVNAALFKAKAGEDYFIKIDNMSGFEKAYDAGLDVDGFTEFFLETKDLDAKDENGKTVSGLKQKRLIEKLKEMDLTDEERAYYYSTYYENEKNNPWKEHLKK